jgi:hypothetical protein
MPPVKSFSSRLETTFAISQGFEPLAGEYVTKKLSTDSTLHAPLPITHALTDVTPLPQSTLTTFLTQTPDRLKELIQILR